MNKVEKDYLGVVVLGRFNAAIGIADICEDLYYDDSVRTYLHPPLGAGEVSGWSGQLIAAMHDGGEGLTLF